MYCYALLYCDMCGRLPFFTEYNSGVQAPQRADSALSLQWLICLLPISKYVMLILCVALLWLLLLPLYWIWKGRKVGGQTSDSIWRIKLFSTSYNIFLNKSATHFLLLIFLDIFSCRRWQDVNVWILRIENVSRADAGIYQCQVTSYLHFHHSRSREAGRHNCPKLPYLYSLPAVNVAHHKKAFLH